MLPITRFFIQLVAAMLLLSSGKAKKPGFITLIASGTILGVALSLVPNILGEHFMLPPVIMFYVMMAYTAALFWICIGGKPSMLLFAFVAALVLQDGTFNLYTLLVNLTGSTETSALGYTLYFAVFIAVYALFYFVFVRRLYAEGDDLIHRNVMLTTIAVFIINQLAGLFIIGSDSYSWSNSEVRFYNVVLSFMALAVQFGLFRQNRLEREKDEIEKMLRQEYKQRKLSSENVELINRKCHDLKHQIAGIRAMGVTEDQKDELKRVEKAVMIYDSAIHTGNNALDIVLMEKGLICDNEDIRLVCLADGTLVERISDTDVYTLFGNILDNAIESARKAEETDTKYISLEIRRTGSMAVIHTENYCSEALSFNEGIPMTTKGDKDYHGYGMRSIKFLAEKYGGTLSCYQEGQLFILNIMLPM